MPENQYYLKRITSEHKKPKFTKWLETNLTFVDDITNITNELDLLFELDNAAGNRLDILGEILGRKRLLDFEPANGASPLLDDEMYRSLQKAKICVNHWDGTIPSAVELWKNLFPKYEIMVVDNQDMTISVYIEPSLNPTPLFGQS